MADISWIYVFIISVGFIDCHGIYTVDNSEEMGRRYEGIGGLSGGGATSKLLVNYPQKQRDEILDYLFKPGYGASLHLLKVEIGGDAQSTDGTEASHMHYSWDENYQRGYEWWLMLEAKKRNPDILLYCLPWAFPAWVGDGTRDPYHNIEKTTDYVIKFISGAWQHYKLRMNYVGIWNERRYDADYIKLLRTKLNKANFTDVLIVASDALWEPISENILLDKDLADAIHAIGVHYPGTKSTETAVNTGKPLWSSEDYSTFNDNVGAGCWARILNQNYVVGNMTSTISWNLIASYYEDLPYSRDGLMTAVSPWSGSYRVESPIWMTAHTTWFVSPGWYYYGHGSGVQLLKNGGSLVSLVSFDSTQLTMVIETMSHDHSKCVRPALAPYDVSPQTVTIELKGTFAKLFQLEVWYSKLGFDGNQTVLMKKLPNIPVINGKIILNLGVDEVYTLTTVSLDARGNEPAIPAAKPFPLPYGDDFENYREFEEPFNLAQQTGTYEIINSHSAHGNVIRQMVLDYPCAWCDAESVESSLNLIGNSSCFNLLQHTNQSAREDFGKSLYMIKDEIILVNGEIVHIKRNFQYMPQCRLHIGKGYAIFKEPFNFSPQVGSFEVQSTADPEHKQVLRQMVIENPIYWCLFIDLVFPMGLLGDFSWTDIYAEVDTRVGTVNATSGVFVASRVNKGGCSTFEAEGIYFFLFPKSGFIEVTGDLARTQQIYKHHVTVAADGWNKLGLLLKDGFASGTLNNEQAFHVRLPDRTPKNGFVALGSSEYGLADFDNLKITTSSQGETIFNNLNGDSPRVKHTENRIYNTKSTVVNDNLYFKPHNNEGT